MDHNLRDLLDQLADRLHLHRGAGEERARELHHELRSAVEGDHPVGLADRLDREAVEFDTEHPELSSALRQVADALNAAGI